MLNNTAYSLTKRCRLTVGYIGGSVTYGFGATDPERTSWRARTTHWLRERYPSAAITDGSAAIGGTGSFLGMCRIRSALLEPYHPDLIFIEYAINDYYQGCSQQESTRQMESMIRQCWQDNPYADIVLVYTTDCGMKGQDFAAVQAFDAVARRYNLCTVNVGHLLQEREGVDALQYKGRFLSDSVHPNDAGYERYAAYVEEFLLDQLENQPIHTPTKHSIPAPLCADWIASVMPMEAEQLAAANAGTGFLYDKSRYVLNSGETIQADFCGCALGLWWQMNPDGQVTLTLDGDISPLPQGNPDGAHKQLYSHLQNCHHRLQISNTGKTTCILRGLYVFA